MQSRSNSTINRSSNNSSGSKSNSPTLRVIPLGGLHEIGKNTCVFEYGDELMLVDAGLAFPSDGMHGVNAVSYTHLRAHETLRYLVCRLLLEKK